MIIFKSIPHTHTIKEKKGGGENQEEIKDEKKIILEKMEIIIQPEIKILSKIPTLLKGRTGVSLFMKVNFGRHDH